MTRQRAQIIGLIGFIISGFLFVWDAWNNGSVLGLTSGILWTLSCVIWLIPEVRS